MNIDEETESHHRRQQRRCCQCPQALQRCSTEQCPCFAGGKKCADNCERSKWASDCLNQTIVKCYCSNIVANLAPTVAQQTHNSNTLGGGGQRHRSKSSSKDKHPEVLSSLCAAFNCDCFKFHERCGLECVCKGDCANTVSQFALTPAERPNISCKCGSGKKSCAKSDKCACKKLLQHCSPTCKCKCDCTNGRFQMDLSKSTKLCFVSPDQETSALVARLTSDAYSFQYEYSNEKNPEKHVVDGFYDALINVMMQYTLPVQRLIVYLTKSPCFHQDCDPKCEVLNECADNRACAKVLATVYRQLRKRAKDTSMQMTVKFLFPNVNRGDLFTKQGIMALMTAGITVEPIGMKEWGELLRDNNNCSKPAQDAIDNSSAYAQYLSTWSTCGMENYVRQSQSYINDCRRVLGMKESYWSSDVHDSLKVSLHVAQKSRTYFDDLSRRLFLINEKSADTSTKQTMTLVTTPDYANSNTLQKPQGKRVKKKYMSRSSSGPMTTSGLKNGGGQQQPTAKLAVFDGANFEDTNFSIATTINDVGGKSHSNNTLAMSNVYLYDAAGAPALTATCFVSGNENVDRLLLALSGRNITEEERADVKRELTIAVENIKLQLQHFTELVEQRITSTSL